MKRTLAVLSAVVLAGLVAGPAAAYDNSVTYSGQGWEDGALEEVNCDEGEGEGYLLWVLTANNADNADITLPGVGTVAMSQSGNGNGAYKYVSDYFEPGDIVGVVEATYDGEATNAQLVVSHGCPGPTS